MRDSWWIGEYHFTCEVEYWSTDGNTARAYWNYGTDKKFGGPGKSGYFIEIKMVPQDYWLSKKIHGWIRLVRPFKGPFGPGNIDQFWQTGKTGEEEKILFEVRDCLQDELSGITYSKERHRTSQHDKVAEYGYSAEEIESIRAENRRNRHTDVMGKNGYSAEEIESIRAENRRNRHAEDYKTSTHGTMSKESQEPKKKKAKIKEIKKKKAKDYIKELPEGDKTKQKKKEKRQKIQTRKAAPKKAIAIVCVVVIIAAVFVLGDGEISLPNISLSDIIESCKVIDSVTINPGQDQESVIDLILCKEKDEELVVVSGDLHKNTKVMIELRKPDGNYFLPQTYVDDFDYQIPKKTYENNFGEWKIKITVNGKYDDDVLAFSVGKT